MAAHFEVGTGKTLEVQDSLHRFKKAPLGRWGVERRAPTNPKCLDDATTVAALFVYLEYCCGLVAIDGPSSTATGKASELSHFHDDEGVVLGKRRPTVLRMTEDAVYGFTIAPLIRHETIDVPGTFKPVN